jgi:hypothetical protein
MQTSTANIAVVIESSLLQAFADPRMAAFLCVFETLQLQCTPMPKQNILFSWIFKAREARIKKDLDAIWHGQADIRRDFDWINSYFQYRRAEETETVDDKTWSDLEMEEMFARIDRTTSPIGRQYLYASLKTYCKTDRDLEQRSKLYTLFRTDSNFRERIQRTLYPLHHEDSGYLTTLFSEELPSKPKYYFLIYLCSGLFFLSLALIALTPGFLLIAAGFATINLCVNAFYGQNVFLHLADLRRLTTMLSVISRLARIDSPVPVGELDILRKHESLVARLKHKAFWLCMDELQSNNMAGWIYLFLNIFGLLRLVVFLRIIDDLENSKIQIREMFEAIGSLDAQIAIASWLESLTVSTAPLFGSAAVIDVEGMYHPLIENAVGYSFSLKGESALITGSNMAGKTSFIKTVGLNLILARTLFVCLAAHAVLPHRIVRSSIKHEDRVVDGQSYYSREVLEILEFLNCAEDHCLFLIDEIFRGTNTVERVAIAASVIRHLTRKNMVLVTTHDVELQSILDDCSRMFHFSEQVEGNRYFFDYVLRPGPCGAGNAIKLLELKGYPPEIVQEARQLASNSKNLLLETSKN